MKNQIVPNGSPRETAEILSEAMDPGMLAEFGGSDDVQKHSTANGGLNPLMVVREQRENQGAGVDDQIASGDEATVVYPEKGETVYVRLGFGSAEHNITRGEALESAGDGTVQSHGTAAAAGEENNLQLVADEAIDNSGASATTLLRAIVV